MSSAFSEFLIFAKQPRPPVGRSGLSLNEIRFYREKKVVGNIVTNVQRCYCRQVVEIFLVILFKKCPDRTQDSIKCKKLYTGLDRRILTCYNNALYPGIAKLVSRLVWECRGTIRDRTRRNAAKPCDTCVCRISSDYRKRHKSSFDHRNDHRQKNPYFYPSPWYHGRKVNIRVWLNW